MDPIQRLNYHTGLFLEETEFKLEQSYHMLMRQRINYALFQPGVVYGMDIDYAGGVLKVKPGMAIDEYSDPDNGPMGREIVVLEETTVPVSGHSPGDDLWITAQWSFSLDAPKAPTNLPARVTQLAAFETSTTDPGPGTTRILLGKIVIGTDAAVSPLQKAVLRLGGAPAAGPNVTNFTPASGLPGSAVTITGTNFTGATEVRFGGVAATTFTVNSATQITVTVPAAAVTGKIRVTTPAGFGQSAADFTVPAAAPTVASFNPTSGGAGTSVVITGTGFSGATAVTFGGVAAATFAVNSATQITATVPAAAATGKIRVTTPAGFGDSAANFTFMPAPLIASFSPASGGVGATVVITGTHLTGTTAVAFAGTAATFAVNSATQITATVPAAAATGKIRVTTPAGFVESATNFTVVPAPVIKSILPTSQAVGGTIQIRGQNIRDGALAPGSLATSTSLRFVDPGNAANKVTLTAATVLTDIAPASGPQRLQVAVPAKGTLPNTVDVVLEIGGVSTTSPQQFTFI